MFRDGADGRCFPKWLTLTEIWQASDVIRRRGQRHDNRQRRHAVRLDAKLVSDWAAILMGLSGLMLEGGHAALLFSKHGFAAGEEDELSPPLSTEGIPIGSLPIQIQGGGARGDGYLFEIEQRIPHGIADRCFPRPNDASCFVICDHRITGPRHVLGRRKLSDKDHPPNDDIVSGSLATIFQYDLDLWDGEDVEQGRTDLSYICPQLSLGRVVHRHPKACRSRATE
jgi:hypothetical protein